MLLWQNTLPTVVLLIAVLLAGAIGLYSAWRFLQRTPGTLGLVILYTLLLAGMLWCLLQPGCRDATRQLIKPRFIVALDTSQSMTVRPDEDMETRFARALRVLEQPWVRSVASESDIEGLGFDREVTPRMDLRDLRELAPEGTATYLRDSLRDIAGRYTGLNVAGMLLLSDGKDTREAFDDWVEDPFPFPIYTVMLEDEAEWVQEPDLRIEAVVSPRRVTSGWTTELRAVISGQGTDGQTTSVQLFREGQLIGEEPVQIPADGGRRNITFSILHDEVGVFQYRVYVPPLPGEQNIADNEYQLTISVQDPRNQLLYVEGVPRFEYRFLRRVLLANEQISPSIFYSSADGTPRGGSAGSESGADMTEADLLQFKVVILGNLSASELTDTRANNLVQFVETGGSLILLGGSRGWGEDGYATSPLQTLMPIRSHDTVVLQGDDPFHVELTDTALAHPAFAGEEHFWSVIPPILSVFPDADPRPAAEVLVNAITPRGLQPVVVTHRYGQGRVAAILTDSLWRWQLAPETEYQPYARFWTQLLAWMLPEDEDTDERRIELFTNHDQIHIGESIEFSARYSDPEMQAQADPPELRITLPDERVVPFPMTPQQIVTPAGRSYPGFTLTYEPELDGFYMADAIHGSGPGALVSDPVSFQVRSFSPETTPAPVRDDILRRLSANSGGRYFENIEGLNRALMNLQVSIQEEERVEFESLWQRWPVLFLLMLLAAGMWILRKIQSLP